jgi:hypothetical protein
VAFISVHLSPQFHSSSMYFLGFNFKLKEKSVKIFAETAKIQ